MHEFFTAALPWVALGVAVAIVMTYSGAGRKKEEKKNIEKQNSGTAQIAQGNTAGTRRRTVRHASVDNLA